MKAKFALVVFFTFVIASFGFAQDAAADYKGVQEAAAPFMKNLPQNASINWKLDYRNPKRSPVWDFKTRQAGTYTVYDVFAVPAVMDTAKSTRVRYADSDLYRVVRKFSYVDKVTVTRDVPKDMTAELAVIDEKTTETKTRTVKQEYQEPTSRKAFVKK
jgi:hypothetical protein